LSWLLLFKRILQHAPTFDSVRVKFHFDVVRADSRVIAVSHGPSSSLNGRDKGSALVMLVLVPKRTKPEAAPSLWMELVAALRNGTKA
jgi:hypothetical protein